MSVPGSPRVEAPAPRRSGFRRWGLPLLLFLLTVGSTTIAGGVAFSATIMSIMLAHEFGHYFVARGHRVEASLPHFIPFPFSIIGTLGAVITMRSDQATRNEIMDIGAAGPLAGFVLAVPAMIMGILLSEPVSLEGKEVVTFFGDSLLSMGLLHLFGPDLAPGFDLEAHPVLVGAWAGFLVTALNLLPMGQLDGGHILYAWSPSRAHIWARRTCFGLFVLGAIGFLVHLPTYLWASLDNVGPEAREILRTWIQVTRPLHAWASPGLIIWGLFGTAMGFHHPPVREADVPLNPRRRWIALVSLAVAICTFMPSPAWIDATRDVTSDAPLR